MEHQSLQWLRRPIEDTSEHPYIILDSGAYSIWRSGAKVDLPKYYDYCVTVKDQTLTCVNLDVIPGAWGRRASPLEVEQACEESFKRWEYLSKSGALIMPVYHQTDSLYWLQKYVAEGAIYIGISPTDSFPARIRQHWLEQVHLYMQDTLHVELKKDVYTHALGVFSPQALLKTPLLWSADASTLLRYVAMKRILYPKYENVRDPSIVSGWEVVYVGSRKATATADNNVDWEAIKRYLASIGHENSYTVVNGRIAIDDFCTLISINLALARKAMHQCGVRCFVAGQLPLAIWQVTVAEHYPYILRSYAAIKETHGNTIKQLFDRVTPKPPRRPERDKQVVPPRGLLTF